MPRTARLSLRPLLPTVAMLAAVTCVRPARAQSTEGSPPSPAPSETAPTEPPIAEAPTAEPQPAEGQPPGGDGTPASDEAPEGAPANGPETPSEPPPPVAFPTDEAPAGEVQSQGPTSEVGDGIDGDDIGGAGYSDHALVEQQSGYRRRWDFTLGLQYAWLKDQLALGPVVAFGQDRFWLDLEIVPVFTLKNAPEIDGNYLGQRFGLAVAYAPIDTKQWRARFGVGGDAYALWGINSEEWKVALALRADVTFWPVKHFGVELGVRGYPFSSDGLSVERGPGGAEWLPFFFTTTLHYRSPGERR